MLPVGAPTPVCLRYTRSDEVDVRIVVWNCRMALHRHDKLDALLKLCPDIAVVPEAGDAEKVGPALASRGIASYEWVGNSPNKGLGVLARAPYRLSPALDLAGDQEWILPLRVTGPVSFTLLAVWAMNHRASNNEPRDNQLRQVDQAIQTHSAKLTQGPVVVAGDFNNAVYWDRPGKPDHRGNFAVTAQLLRDIGLVSAYHHAGDQELPFGDEPPTLYWKTQKVDGPGYHIDYCFVPESWTVGLGVKMGTHGDWVASGLSDHVPLVIDILGGETHPSGP